MSEEELHGAEGRVKLRQGGTDIDKRIWGEAPVRIEVTEDGEHRNLLARDAEIMLSARDDGSVTLNLSMEDVEEVSFDDWQAGNHSAVEDE